jgi:hypothetical protein
MLHAIDEPTPQIARVDSKDLFFTTKTNYNTLHHLVSKELNGFHHYWVDAYFKCALTWWHTKKTQIPYHFKVGKTHSWYSCKPCKLKFKGFFILEESSQHFTNVVFKLIILIKLCLLTIIG